MVIRVWYVLEWHILIIDGKPLTSPRFVARIREALNQAGVSSEHYSGRSFRSRAATTAASQGVAETTIKMLGSWKSSAYQLYIKTPCQQLAAILVPLDQTELVLVTSRFLISCQYA